MTMPVMLHRTATRTSSQNVCSPNRNGARKVVLITIRFSSFSLASCELHTKTYGSAGGGWRGGGKREGEREGGREGGGVEGGGRVEGGRRGGGRREGGREGLSTIKGDGSGEITDPPSMVK